MVAVQPADAGCHMVLPCGPEAAAPARKLVESAFEAWSGGQLIDAGKLLVTELVAALSQCWGVTCESRGKWVWFELRLEAS
ncbi:hypothetical protein HUT16_20485 [Kitasatospora sp. NA04385]|nr:hypothetical protein HUT16_20485 [Kitasatospora sp. NA04385]